jgi:hypothetical protein
LGTLVLRRKEIKGAWRKLQGGSEVSLFTKNDGNQIKKVMVGRTFSKHGEIRNAHTTSAEKPRE